MKKINIVTVEDEHRISRPERPIKLNQYTGLESERAWELANLIRIAATDYKCFNNWFNDLDISQIENGGKSKEFTLEKDRELIGIEPRKNNPWIYANKKISNSTIKEYHLLTESDVEDNNLISQFTDDEYYKYKVLKTYEYLAYYPAKLDVDIDRFGFIAERQEGDNKIVFIVFRGTRELGEWFNNAQFKQVNFLEMDDYSDGIEGYGKISLGFNKMYTGFRPGIFIDYDNLNEISRRSDAFFRRILERIDNVKIKYKSIYKAINEYFSNGDLNTNTDIYISGHSLGGAPKLSLDLFRSLFSLAPKDPKTMENTIIKANNIENIPPGYLPNSILFWYGLGIDEQVKSFSKQSLKLLATLYSRLEECKKVKQHRS